MWPPEQVAFTNANSFSKYLSISGITATTLFLWKTENVLHIKAAKCLPSSPTFHAVVSYRVNYISQKVALTAHTTINDKSFQELLKRKRDQHQQRKPHTRQSCAPPTFPWQKAQPSPNSPMLTQTIVSNRCSQTVAYGGSIWNDCPPPPHMLGTNS